MRSIIIASLACASLASCQTTSFDAALANNLPTACKALTGGYAAFEAAEPLFNIKQGTIDKVAAIYDGVDSFCVSAPKDTASAAVAVLTAALQIASELKKAKANG